MGFNFSSTQTIMQWRDIKRFFGGLDNDTNAADVAPGDYVGGLNIRTGSSDEQHGVNPAETLQGEIMVDILGEATYYYGEAIGGSFIYEGYAEVQIGGQVWMKKNWDADYPGSKVYDDDEANRAIYGGLYTWEQIMQPDFCPAGWHVPTMAELNILLAELGGAAIAGGKMKEPATEHWLTPNTGADDSSGFKALPGGQFDVIFDLLGEKGKFWLQDELPPIYDIDGNEYDVIRVGNQEWIVQNLRTTKYADGTPIPHLPVDLDWAAEDGTPGHDGAYCAYNNDPLNIPDYGAMYNWYAVVNAHGLAYFEKGGVPEVGWRIPTNADFVALQAAAGGLLASGGYLKEAGLAHWDAPNTDATNSYGFKATGGGGRNNFDGSFDRLKGIVYLWASTETFFVGLWRGDTFNILNNSAQGFISYDYKALGATVRCVRDV
jgi:uncharacterized protein (TIGR02145 family)